MSSSKPIKFADFGLANEILAAISEIGYEQPTPVQAASIPFLLEGKDIIGVAQTGTGKTAAFALPLLSRLKIKKNTPQVLVLAPTRELAIQVSEAFQTYATKMSGFHVLPIYGGQDMRTQLRQLKRGAHVIVGTPGRVMDHLRRNSLDLSGLEAVVLDEADEMLRMGFIDDVTWILEHTPKTRQVALFSATMPDPIRKVANTYLNSPEEVRIETKTTTQESIEQYYWLVRGVNKLDALTRILEVEQFDGIIVFVRTKTSTADLAEKLEARGFASAPINGDMNQALRERTIERLKSGKLDILVATDVAARGIDVTRVSHVINYDIPYDAEAYVHRIGRTGRAGRPGKAILFVAPRERRLLRFIEKSTRQPIKELKLPSREQISDRRIADFKQQILETLSSQELTFYRSVVDNFVQENSSDPAELAAALVYLAQQQRPLLLPKERSPEREHPRDRDDHKDRGSRKDRGDRKDKKFNDKRHASINEKLETYRIEVGKHHQVSPGEIVGAIANEANIDSKFIGRIKIHEKHSSVQLPSDLSHDAMEQLKKIKVRQRPLNLSKMKGEPFDRKRDKKFKGKRD